MDDVYFGVLRVWHLLTSNKKVLVSIVGVIAVVATVTTVVAAPTEDEAAPTVVNESPDDPAGVVASDVAAVTDTLVIGDVSDPGILPTSPFYPLKVLAREVALVFTFDSVDKANRRLGYANENLLAMCALHINDTRLALDQCSDYEDDFWDSILWVAKARDEGHDVQGVMTNLRSAHDSHRAVFTQMLAGIDQVGHSVLWGGDGSHEDVRAAVIEAAAATSAELEFAIMAMQGPGEATVFHSQLQNDFSQADRVVWLEIENRLGMPEEQAIALISAIEQEGTVGGTPIITSMRVDSFRLDPGRASVIECMATDMEGDVLAYAWSAEHGSIEGEGSKVTWTAPENAGEYRIGVTVSDVNGNESSKAVTLIVSEEGEESASGGGPFSIDGFDVSGNLCSEQVWAAEDWLVFQGREVDITCLIDGDADGLEYEWKCVRVTKVRSEFVESNGSTGSFTGRGQTVTWEAFEGGGYGRIVVDVSDGSGSVKTASLIFRVTTCASCIK